VFGKNKATFHKQEGGFIIFAALFLTRAFQYARRRKAGLSKRAEIEDGYTRVVCLCLSLVRQILQLQSVVS
jgi:hypothetical protein